VTEIAVQNFKVRCVTAYGPQSMEKTEKKVKFWAKLGQEVEDAMLTNRGFILQMDSNSHLGDSIIKGDPCKLDQNGVHFLNFLQKYPHLQLVNSMPITEGLITRKRVTVNHTEISVIDFFVVCEKIVPFLEKLVIDENKEHCLTSYYTKKGSRVVKDSDHNTMILELTLNFTLKFPRTEIFKIKNTENQMNFKKLTSEDNKLSRCFSLDGDIEMESKEFIKVFSRKFSQSFPKVRISNKSKPSPHSNLIMRRDNLKQQLKSCGISERDDLEEQLNELEEKICSLVEEENMRKFIQDFGPILNAESSEKNNSIWKVKRKVFSKHVTEQPSAKFDPSGRLVTDPEELKRVMSNHFTQRLRNRPIITGMEELKNLKEELCEMRLEYVRGLPFETWTMEDLDKTLASLKKNKSKDPYGIISELLRPEMIGRDLKEALLLMLNQIKIQMKIPSPLTKVNIIPIYKGKGDRRLLENQRGIFIANKFKEVLLKIIYNEEYDVIDNNMSDSNIGARRKMNIRNHIFIINSIINESIQKRSPCDVIISDYRQCFDGLWTHEVSNDLFDNGVDNRNLGLIHEANKRHKVTVKTSVGETEEETVTDTVLQGETIAPLACSSHVDYIGKECVQEGKYLYMYRESVGVPPLTLIDDSIAVAKCGVETLELNEYLNAKSNLKKLQYSEDKCMRMHVGKKKDECVPLKINSWKVSNVKNLETSKYEICDEIGEKFQLKEAENTTYLGDVISFDAKNTKNIRKRKEKGYIIMNQIKKILEDGFYGKYYFQAAILLRESLFLNSILLNSEVWMNLKEKDLKELSVVDNALLRLIWNCASYVSVPMMFLELGILPLTFIVMKRRVMFLHYLLQQKEETLLFKCFEAQWSDKLPGDWAGKVEEDLRQMGLKLTLQQIKSMSKHKFKELIKSKIENLALKYLLKEKNKQSKCCSIKFDKLQIQDYLKSDILTTSNKQLLFQLRTASFPVFANIKFMVDDTRCPCCYLKEDTLSHQLECSIIHSGTKQICNTNVHIEDVFSPCVEDQTKITLLFEQSIKRRKIVMKHMK